MIHNVQKLNYDSQLRKNPAITNKIASGSRIQLENRW